MTQALLTRCYNCGRTRRTTGRLCQHCEQEEQEITHGNETETNDDTTRSDEDND